mmetsp:Transcript_111538/g.314951  ORF Transcript_111538/g.314951 Transcript_111538/m.314951 type:complete len:238 (+) Transcript_111538:230-943(+)
MVQEDVTCVSLLFQVLAIDKAVTALLAETLDVSDELAQLLRDVWPSSFAGAHGIWPLLAALQAAAVLAILAVLAVLAPGRAHMPIFAALRPVLAFTPSAAFTPPIIASFKPIEALAPLAETHALAALLKTFASAFRLGDSVDDVVALWFVVFVQSYRERDFRPYGDPFHLLTMDEHVVAKDLLQFVTIDETEALLLVEGLDDAPRPALAERLRRGVRQVRHREGHHCWRELGPRGED